jgi:hypothetical protein
MSHVCKYTINPDAQLNLSVEDLKVKIETLRSQSGFLGWCPADPTTTYILWETEAQCVAWIASDNATNILEVTHFDLMSQTEVTVNDFYTLQGNDCPPWMMTRWMQMFPPAVPPVPPTE